MAIEPVLNFFDFGTEPFGRLVNQFRENIFKEVAASDLPGLIFTYVWPLDSKADHQEIQFFANFFSNQGGRICYAELEADLEERLARNRTPLRLLHKPSKKRNPEKSEANIQEWEGKYKMNSNDDFPYPNHIKINNTQLSPEQVAQQIAEHFNLPSI